MLDRSLCLAMFAGLDEESVEYVCDRLISVVRSVM